MSDRDDVTIIRVRERAKEKGKGSGGGALLALLAFIGFINLGKGSSTETLQLAKPPAGCVETCVGAYRSFLAEGGGRAFVLSSDGKWSWRAGEMDDRVAVGQALKACVAAGGIDCRAVVIGSHQLDNAAN